MIPIQYEVRLSAFLDECTRPRLRDGKYFTASVEDQLAMGQAIGLSLWVPRWFNFGTLDQPMLVSVGQLSEAQLKHVLDAQQAYGFRAHCLGSFIGKDDLYGDARKYLDEVVHPAVVIATKLGVESVRLFSFRPPTVSDAWSLVGPAAERLAPIVELFLAAGIQPLLEIESNLIGDRGAICAAITNAVGTIGSGRLGLIWDWGNVYSQGLDPWTEWQAMRMSVTEFHGKYYDGPRPSGHGPIDENALSHYVPADATTGLARPEPILSDLYTYYPSFMEANGGKPLVIVAEPHQLGGGVKGGQSGAIGMGVAARGLCRVLDATGFAYHLHGHEDVVAVREALQALERKA